MTIQTGQQQGDTGNGFLVGVEPATQVPPAVIVEPTPAQQQQQPPPPANNNGGGQQPRVYTEEEVNRIRQEEKDKLYGRLQSTDQELAQLKAEREAREKEAREAEDARLAEIRKKEEEGMEVRQLLERREAEWDTRFKELAQTQESERALFAKERRLQEVERYRQSVIDQAAEYILPELRDLIQGDDESQIDAAVQTMIERTQSIVQQIAAAQGQSRQQMRGAAPTAPPVGPMEQLPAQQQWTAKDIEAMSMDEYKKHREGLLRGAGNAYRGG